jgi:hypothetical protein
VNPWGIEGSERKRTGELSVRSSPVPESERGRFPVDTIWGIERTETLYSELARNHEKCVESRPGST